LRMDKALNLIISAGGICNVALGFVIVPAYGAPAMSIARVVAEALVTSAMMLYLWGQRDRLFEKLKSIT